MDQLQMEMEKLHEKAKKVNNQFIRYMRQQNNIIAENALALRMQKEAEAKVEEKKSIESN